MITYLIVSTLLYVIFKCENYKDEYKKFQSSSSQKLDRASRNKARRVLMKKGLVRKGDGKDIDHKDGNPKNNTRKNLKLYLVHIIVLKNNCIFTENTLICK